jgi:acyl-CoA oxidase
MFAHSYASNEVLGKYYSLLEDIKKSKFELLDIVHHFSSGMKSVYSSDCYDGMILIRQALGGAGYSAWSAIPGLIEDYSPQVTYEGDNTVMAQQSAGFLFKQAKRALKSKESLGGPF